MCLKLCKSEKVVLGNKEILIRRPEIRDLTKFLEFINCIADENLMVNTNRRFTLNEERKWLENSLADIRKNKLHLLNAFYKGEIIADVSVRKGDFRHGHVGTFGIMIKDGYRSIGLGKFLAKRIIEIAKKDSDIKILYLDVFVNNRVAIKLYKKLGF